MKTLNEIMNAEYEKGRSSKKGLIISIILGSIIGIVGGCLLVCGLVKLCLGF